MPGGALGRWSPLPVADVVAIMEPFPGRWWIGGGHALELFVGGSWRSHDDVDVGICRHDAPALRELLRGWDIRITARGALQPWDGATPNAGRDENNLWCRHSPGEPWQLDVTVGEGDDGEWIYRRDRTIRRAWDEAVLRTLAGVPFLAPELQLLFKSKVPRPKDDLDARVVVPRLDARALAFLRDHLAGTHPWQALLPAAPPR